METTSLDVFCDGACEPTNPGGTASWAFVIKGKGVDDCGWGYPVQESASEVASHGVRVLPAPWEGLLGSRPPGEHESEVAA